jgi:putative FmdB family regulatory protein
MPIYDFRCADGHVTERVRTIDTAAIACPECGENAERLVGAPSMIVGPTLHTELQRPQKYRDAHERAEHGFRHVGAKRP